MDALMTILGTRLFDGLLTVLDLIIIAIITIVIIVTQAYFTNKLY